jgi:hypothetical protein
MSDTHEVGQSSYIPTAVPGRGGHTYRGARRNAARARREIRYWRIKPVTYHRPRKAGETSQ